MRPARRRGYRKVVVERPDHAVGVPATAREMSAGDTGRGGGLGRFVFDDAELLGEAEYLDGSPRHPAEVLHVEPAAVYVQ